LASNYDAAGSADTAQTNAQNYADSLASNYDASGSASTAQTNAQNYADSLASNYDAAGSADTAQTNAQNYADSLASNYDAAGSADTAQTNAQNYTDSEIGALTTADITEEPAAVNQWFTDSRAKDSAADLLTNATLTNITITGTGSGLTITAENGVADSDTDDLLEGTSNLYFSNARAVSALEAVTPNFQSVDVTWVRREEATWTDVVTASTVTAHEFATSEGSVKYLVRIFQGGDSQVSEVLVTTDSSNNIAVLEYGTIYTSANPLATITADWDSVNSKYRLRVTTANNSSEILVAATMLAYND
jgi:hypothetical protein